ncbi:MAG: flagellar export protein FliJ [Verrucomicrobiota bacterium]|nr:flagellar export protein FliJ [Verrucomicrobiota bacterium]
MKPFKFTLEAVMTVRERSETEAKAAFGSAIEAHGRAVAMVNRLEQQITQHLQAWRDAMSGGGFSPALILQLEHGLKVLETEKQKGLVQMLQAEKNVSRARDHWQRTRQDCEVVQKFHERQVRAHRQEEMRMEQQLLDEMASRQLESSFTFCKS